MTQMYKVFVNHKEVILTTTPPDYDQAMVSPLKSTSLAKMLQMLRSTNHKTLYLVHHNPDKLIPLLKKKLPVIVAGGGVVQNEQGKILFIYRKKKWDLPKGRIDNGETLEQGSKREVKEETGVKKLKVGDLAGITYHIFKRSNRYQLKETFWFYMTTTFQGELVPETKEDITKAVWKGKKKTIKALEKTYPNIAYLFSNMDLIKSLPVEE